MEQSHNALGRATFGSYLSGFLLSLMLTVDAYMLVSKHLVHNSAALFTIASLAIGQLAVQLVFFLHLGRESKPRWNLLAFGFMLMVVVVVVFGSLWIMQNLNYHMSPGQVNTYLSNQNAL